MIRKEFEYEVISPCFCGGAKPEERAEIRIPSIRGQLRWWFRALGGFKGIYGETGWDVRRQEDYIFGNAASDSGKAGKAIFRLQKSLVSNNVQTASRLGFKDSPGGGYLLFPLQKNDKFTGRAAIMEGRFTVCLLWQGDAKWIPHLEALMVVFGELGSLGFRSRRAMGAIKFLRNSHRDYSLDQALLCFKHPESFIVKEISLTNGAMYNNSNDVISALGRWLKNCRSHGRDGKNTEEKQSPYFKFAKNDHDIGYGINKQSTPVSFRPALGLPIIQNLRKGKKNWEFGLKEGRFASPVLLRPYKTDNQEWKALVIFVECYKWPEGHPVFVEKTKFPVSLELYNKMKEDINLQPFTPS